MQLGAMHVRVGALLGISAIVAAGLGIAPVTEEASAAPNLSPRASTSGFTYVVDDSIALGFGDGARDVLYVENPGPADDTVYASIESGGSRPDLIAAINYTSNDPALTVDDSIELPVTAAPYGLELGSDDTIYVALSGSNRVGAINARTNALDDSEPTAAGPMWVAITADNTPQDDTVYVTSARAISLVNASPFALDDTYNLPGGDPSNSNVGAGGVVTSADDTVYVAGYNLPDGKVWPMRDDTWVAGGVGINLNTYGNVMIAIYGDDTLYVPSSFGNQLAIMDIQTNAVSYVGPDAGYLYQAQAAAYDPTYKRLYVTNYGASVSFVSVIDFSTSPPTFDDTIPVGDYPMGLAISPDGTRVFVANFLSPYISVIRVTPPTVTFNANGGSGSMTPQTSQVPANLTANVFTRAGYTFTGWNTAPGSNGTSYANQAQFPFNVTLTLYAQWRSDAPPPSYPPGPPTQVKAVAGDASAAVSWTAPSDSGSYPVTDYEVTSTPGDHTCLAKVPALTCQVTGLTNRTSYSFAVRALNGAGWGAYSSPSNSVTPTAPPKPTIMITGSRDSADTRYVKVSGTTTDLVGKQVTPWVRFPGESTYSAGTGVRTVKADGTFAWERKTGKKIYVYFQHEDVKSNTVTMPAR